MDSFEPKMWQRRIKLRRDYDVRPAAIKETNRQGTRFLHLYVYHLLHRALLVLESVRTTQSVTLLLCQFDYQ